MNDPYVFILLMDIQNNVLLLSYNQYITFLSTKVTKFDQPIGDSSISASKVAALRLIKEKLHLLTSHERLDDISLYDITGNKLQVFIHRVNDEEKKLILDNNISGSNFISINNLPTNLDILSSAISQAITTYPYLILNTTTPPSNQSISFSKDIKKYSPNMEVPLLMPVHVYEKNKNNKSNKIPIQSQIQVPVQVPVQNEPIQDNSQKINKNINKPAIFHANEIRTTELNINENTVNKIDKNDKVDKNDKKCLELENKYLKYKEKYLIAKQDIIKQSKEFNKKYLELEKELNELKNKK
jgi:hypothetical protein